MKLAHEQALVKIANTARELQAVHPWWCEFDASGHCKCGLATLKTLVEELRQLVCADNAAEGIVKGAGGAK